jgi:hypothetical protein
MYIETVPNRASPPAILLRESTRAGRKVRKRTLANLSHWPAAKIEVLRRALRSSGAPAPDSAPALVITASVPHGHVQAVLGVVRRLGLDTLLGARRTRPRDLVVAMIAARILFPVSKLDTVARWGHCTLAEELHVGDADERELYQALDWLLSRQPAIEQRLAARRLREGASVLHDLSSSFYGTHCPLARFGHDRDKKGLPIIAYGVLADAAGCPVATQVYAGHTADPRTVADQAQKLKQRLGLQRVVLVGDRGCITQTQIRMLQEYPGVGWIGALKSGAIKKLVEQQRIQPSLFDQQHLAEITAQDYPGERLVACFNPFLADQRRAKRQELLAATEKGLEKIAGQVRRRKHKALSASEIGVKVGRVIHHYKMAKHFEVDIGAGTFSYRRRADAIAREEQLDGIYVIRTSEPPERLAPADAVRRYKGLAQVERAFRCFTGVDLMVRPIYLRTEDHVKAHICLCLLAYYVAWHMRRALAELLDEDQALEALRSTRDPVLPAVASESARLKKATHRTAGGLPAQSWPSLLQALGTLCRNTCRMNGDPSGPTFVVHTDANELQQRALDLLACAQYDDPKN